MSREYTAPTRPSKQMRALAPQGFCFTGPAGPGGAGEALPPPVRNFTAGKL